jgi:hypothetical protein
VPVAEDNILCTSSSIYLTSAFLFSFILFITFSEAYSVAFIIIIAIHLKEFIDWLRILFLEEFNLLKYTKNIYLNNKEKEKK